MTTVAADQSHAKWEYLELSRKTEAYLVSELNELGQAGWELVAVTYRRDPKGLSESWCWTAFAKRPFTGQSAAGKAAGAGTAVGGGVRRGEQADEGDIFDVRD